MFEGVCKCMTLTETNWTNYAKPSNTILYLALKNMKRQIMHTSHATTSPGMRYVSSNATWKANIGKSAELIYVALLMYKVGQVLSIFKRHAISL
jgi:hypothetical protein